MRAVRNVTVTFGLLVASLFLFLCATTAQAQGVWTRTNSMTAARSGQTATLLTSGKVLVAGGENLIGNVRTAELYNQSTGSWVLTGNNPNVPRALASAVRLTNGKVLTAGGCNTDCIGALRSSELYDPSAGTTGRGQWTLTGYMVTARFSFTATLLANGKVLVAGGCTATNCTLVTNRAELYNPATGTWTATGSMKFARGNHTATRLGNGMVLVAGGINSSADVANAELYNPTTGTWSTVGNMHFPRSGHIAVLLTTGKVLVAGGGGPADSLAGAELYNPSTKTWAITGNLKAGRDDFSAVLLPSGKVLAAGGANLAGTSLRSAELYNPTTGTWAFTGSMSTARIELSLTLLADGQALAAGGTDGLNAFFSSAELYHP